MEVPEHRASIKHGLTINILGLCLVDRCGCVIMQSGFVAREWGDDIPVGIIYRNDRFTL